MQFRQDLMQTMIKTISIFFPIDAIKKRHHLNNTINMLVYEKEEITLTLFLTNITNN